MLPAAQWNSSAPFGMQMQPQQTQVSVGSTPFQSNSGFNLTPNLQQTPPIQFNPGQNWQSTPNVNQGFQQQSFPMGQPVQQQQPFWQATPQQFPNGQPTPQQHAFIQPTPQQQFPNGQQFQQQPQFLNQLHPQQIQQFYNQNPNQQIFPQTQPQQTQPMQLQQQCPQQAYLDPQLQFQPPQQNQVYTMGQQYILVPVADFISFQSNPEGNWRRGTVPPGYFQGRGPALFTSDPRIKSPMFDWIENKYTGEAYHRGINPAVYSSLSQPPEAAVLANMRQQRWFGEHDYRRPRSDSDFGVPAPVGLFNYPFKGYLDQSPKPFRGPPKFNEGIDPVSGLTMAEKFNKLPQLDKRMHYIQPLPKMSIDTVYDHKPSFMELLWLRKPTSSSSSSILNDGRKYLQKTSASLSKPIGQDSRTRLNLRQVRELAPQFMAPKVIEGRRLSSGVKLLRPNYYCIPDVATLDLMTKPNRQCIVQDFAVGHNEFGKIIFPDEMDVAGLNLDAIINFQHKQIEVYKDNAKPPYGHELNRRAVVSLVKVWPKHKVTGEFVKDVKEIKHLVYEDVLRRSCERFGGRFLNYNPVTGTWVFEIQLNP